MRISDEESFREFSVVFLGFAAQLYIKRKIANIFQVRHTS